MVGAANPYRYKSYYYDAETNLYYLQSRYYDAQVQRFVSPDMPELMGVCYEIYAHNFYLYCDNNPIALIDFDGHLSLNGLLSKMKDAFNKIIGKFADYLRSLIRYDKFSKTLKINTNLISVAIDSAVIIVVNKFIYMGIKTGMKLLLKNNGIRTNFVKNMFEFFTKDNGIGKAVLWAIVHIGFVIAGRGWMSNAINNVMRGFVVNIVTEKSYVLSRASSLISAFSSFGGIVAFFVDLMDGKWDDYATLKV